MNVKKLIAVGTIAACVLGLAACGSANASDTGMTYDKITLGETGKDLTTTITLYTHRTDMLQDTYNGKNWKQYVAEFNKMYPNITVKVENNPNDEVTRLQGGDWGDIMMMPTSLDASDLGDYFLPFGTVDNLKDEIRYPYAQEYGNNVYGISSNGNLAGVVYNKRVFKDAGVTDTPRTPDEFIAALKKIKENTDAIPLYTNYAAGWTMSAWDAYIGGTATGDAKYMKQTLLHTEDPFSDPGDGTHAYNVYKILYDAVSDGLIEDDFSTTDWEGSKSQMNSGKIATMVLGSWAVSQIQGVGDNADDIGYMPFPITVGGKQYASSVADRCYGINKDVPADEQEGSMIFVKWMTEKSNFATNEGGLPVDKTDDTLPDVYSEFGDVTFLEDEPSVKGEEDLFNNLNSDSELSINASSDARVQAVVEHASNKTKSYDDIIGEWNQAWNDALKTENAEIKYATVAD